MSFERQMLSDDEDVLVDTRLHWVPLVGPAALTLLAVAGVIAIAVEFPGAPVAVTWVLAAMVVLPALWLLGRFLRWRGVRLIVTNGRLLYRRGVLGRDVAQLRLARVAEVHCTQTAGGRLIGCGRLVLEVAGGEAMVVDDVRRPRALQRVIAGQLDGSWFEYPGQPGYSAHLGYQGRPRYRGQPGYTGDGLDWSTARPEPPATAVPAPTIVPAERGITDTPPHGTAARRWRTGLFPETTSAPAGVPGAVAPVAASVPDQLIALDQLRRRGIITDDEFGSKKAELLRRL